MKNEINLIFNSKIYENTESKIKINLKNVINLNLNSQIDENDEFKNNMKNLNKYQKIIIFNSLKKLDNYN